MAADQTAAVAEIVGKVEAKPKEGSYGLNKGRIIDVLRSEKEEMMARDIVAAAGLDGHRLTEAAVKQTVNRSNRNSEDIFTKRIDPRLGRSMLYGLRQWHVDRYIVDLDY